MNRKKLPEEFPILPDMYQDEYYPNFLVDKLKNIILECISELESGGRSLEQVQESFDRMTIRINEMEDEFNENDSEIETGARESIGETIGRILKYFEINMDIEDAIRERDW